MRKPITNYENYMIYENGDVLNQNTNQILKGSIGENGYKYYRLSKNNNKKMFYAHRLVAEAFLPNPENFPVVNHIDGNKLNNNLNNLEWCSYSKNTEHWYENNKVSSRQKYEKYKEDLENEIWKDVLNYSNYRISSYGRVHNKKTNNILHPALTCGYHKVRLSEEGKVEDFLVHKLVYSTFNKDYDLENYVIDHIDGNKINNKLNNLRKITFSENVNAAYYTQKTNKNCKRVGQYSLTGEFIQEFPSTREASRILGLDASAISKLCRGVKYKSLGGFIFKYL